MILSIVPELTDEVVLNSPHNVKVIDYKAFNSLEIHPFIATHLWERVDIVLGKGIKSSYITQVLTRCNIVSAIIPNGLNIDYEIVARLSEIYPNIASELRRLYIQKKDIKSLLLREGVTFEGEMS